jgi:formate hydrogenlyase subunit 3/multisubunit Na+/H+ antiporter MnhD subunit
VSAAQDGFLFLLAWEIMALSPFFLVIFDGMPHRRLAVAITSAMLAVSMLR